jgi:hypothetical protein
MAMLSSDQAVKAKCQRKLIKELVSQFSQRSQAGGA